MNRLIRYFSVSIVSISIWGCGNKIENNPSIISSAKALDSEAKPSILSEVKADSMVDANKNGISDEIDAYIKMNYPNASDKAAAEQYARILKPSELLSSSAVNKSKPKPKPVECVFYAFDAKHKKPPKPRPKYCEEIPTPNNEAKLIAELEKSGAIPQLERGNTLAGIDNDKNGIRDDIDTYIQKNYTQPEQKKAVEQYAKKMQLSVLADTTDSINVKKISIKGSRAIHCIFIKFKLNSGDKNPLIVSSEIESITTNTKPRLLAYLAYNQALDGMAFMLPEGDTCE